jgi:hypothetical protein
MCNNAGANATLDVLRPLKQDALLKLCRAIVAEWPQQQASAAGALSRFSWLVQQLCAALGLHYPDLVAGRHVTSPDYQEAPGNEYPLKLFRRAYDVARTIAQGKGEATVHAFWPKVCIALKYQQQRQPRPALPGSSNESRTHHDGTGVPGVVAGSTSLETRSLWLNQPLLTAVVESIESGQLLYDSARGNAVYRQQQEQGSHLLSYGNYKQWAHAIGWAQTQQQLLATGTMNLDRINSHPSVANELAIRKRVENARREGLDEDRCLRKPELRPVQVDIACAEALLDLADCEEDMVANIMTGEQQHISLQALARDNNLRDARLCEIGHQIVTKQMSAFKPIGAVQRPPLVHTQLIAWTTKTNPGNIVQLFQFIQNVNPAVCAHGWLVMRLFSIFHMIGSHDVSLPDGTTATQRGLKPPDFLDQSAWYKWRLNFSGQDPTKALSLAHSIESRRSMQRRGQLVAKHAVHDGRATGGNRARVEFGVKMGDLKILGLWNNTTAEMQYEQYVPPDCLANMAGCGDIDEYYLPHNLLDPKKIPEFADMASAVFPWAPDLYAKVCASNKEVPIGKRVIALEQFLHFLTSSQTWFWQQVAALYQICPGSILWRTSFFSQFHDNGQFQRWCSVSNQLATTYERGVSAMRSPTFGLLSRTSLSPHGVMAPVIKSIQV